jgi:hypothetical protein
MVKTIRCSRGALTKRNRKQYRLRHTKRVRRSMNGGKQSPVPCPVPAIGNKVNCISGGFENGLWEKCGEDLCVGSNDNNNAAWVNAESDDPRARLAFFNYSKGNAARPELPPWALEHT